MQEKTVFLNGAPVGVARTWHEAAAVVSKLVRRGISARDAQNYGSEGPNGFYIDLPPSPDNSA